jgi:hypothetical protein
MIEPDKDDDWWKRGRSPDDELDDEDLEEEDADGETVIRCPHCGEEVYDDAEQCLACGSWITGEERAWTGRPSWFVVLGVIVALLTILTWIVWWR